MKRFLLFALLFVNGMASAQLINIPDPFFKSRLLSSPTNAYWTGKDASGQVITIDANNDGEIQQTEAEAVYQLNLGQSNISSLIGIEAFTNLTVLDCSTNHLTSLDVTALSSLASLNCRVNELISLNVSGLASLTYLSFEWNSLTSFSPTGLTALAIINSRKNNLMALDVSLFPALTQLSCEDNQISVLNAAAAPLLQILSCNNNVISNLTITGLNLTYFDYSDNPLPNVDVSGMSTLTGLSCRNVGAPSFNFSGLTLLETLDCSNNPISIIDTQDLESLQFIYCNNTQILQLDLSNSPGLLYFGAGNNPLLTSVNIHNNGLIEYPGECNLANNPSLMLLCIDEGEEDIMLQYFESNQILPPYMSTTCEYIPGQVYNTISGKITLDINGNGCTNSDPSPRYYPVKIFDGTTEKIKYANQNGDYVAYVGAGTYTLTAPFNGTLFGSSPATASVIFASMNNDTFVQDFCIAPQGIVDDVSVTLSPGFSMPGFDTYCHVLVSNNGNTVANGTVTFDYDNSILDYVMTYPQAGTVAPGTVTWGYSNLMPFESRSYTIKVNVNSPTEIPAVNIDDILTFNATAYMQGNDVNTADNVFETQSLVVGSFDPNNIICMQGDIESIDNIGKYLDYLINFENTGNAAATFVVVSQELDDEKFDVSSFEVLGISHPADITRIGNKVVFRFENIDLAAAAQGNIFFRIKTLDSLEEGEQVMNRANIVFDYNYALITNEAITIFEVLLGKDKFLDNLVYLYPNPVKDQVTVTSPGNIASLELIDIHGRILQTLIPDSKSSKIDISERQSGIYFARITTDKGVVVKKFIKE